MFERWFVFFRQSTASLGPFWVLEQRHVLVRDSELIDERVVFVVGAVGAAHDGRDNFEDARSLRSVRRPRV